VTLIRQVEIVLKGRLEWIRKHLPYKKIRNMNKYHYIDNTDNEKTVWLENGN